MILLTGKEIDEVLGQLQAQGVLLRVNEHDKMPYSVRLMHWAEDKFSVLANAATNSGPPALGSQANFRFRLVNYPFSFESQLLGLESDGKSVWSAPQVLTIAESRSHIRVTNEDLPELTAELALNNAWVTGSVIDLSHSGMRIHISSESENPVQAGSVGTIAVQNEDHLVILDCIVMWRTKSHCGILLPGMRSVDPGTMSNSWIQLLHRRFLLGISRRASKSSAD